MPAPLICRRCSRPIVVEAAQYEVFEHMHYVCVHYEFEHDPIDPDEECGAGTDRISRKNRDAPVRPCNGRLESRPRRLRNIPELSDRPDEG